VRLVQEELPVAQGGFSVLVDRDDDCLDMLVAPASRGAKRRTSASALIHSGLSALWSYHLGGSDGILFPANCVFQLSTLARQQKLRSRAIEACLLELANRRPEFEQLATQLQYLQLI
jgi:hypothetical protein